jgi:Mn-dependent DtxR family transcriptional regulator
MNQVEFMVSKGLLEYIPGQRLRATDAGRRVLNALVENIRLDQ